MGVQQLIRKRGWQVPHWARIAVTLCVLMALGHLLFFPPAMKGGLADRVCDSIKVKYCVWLPVHQ